MSIKINSAKLVKGEILNLSYDERPEKGKVSTVKGHEYPGEVVHNDLKNAFQACAIHSAILNGYVKSSLIEDIDSFDMALIDGFNVTSYSRGGDDDAPGIVISGHYKHAQGVTILNTPFKRFDEGDKTRYLFMDDLIKKIAAIDSEIMKFIDEEKRGSDSQLSLFDQAQNKKIIEEKKRSTKIQILPDTSEKKVQTGGMPSADPDAMQRVKAMDNEKGTEFVELPKTNKGAKKGTKKVAQSADHPSGEAHD